MYAVRQIIEDPPEFIPIPPELRHCGRLEVIFIALDQPPEDDKPRLLLVPGASHVEHHRE